MHGTETLKNLLNSGAGLRIDAKVIGINGLNELAAIAHSSNAQLTIYNAGQLIKDSIERLAVVGGRSISFEF